MLVFKLRTIKNNFLWRHVIYKHTPLTYNNNYRLHANIHQFGCAITLLTFLNYFLESILIHSTWKPNKTQYSFLQLFYGLKTYFFQNFFNPPDSEKTLDWTVSEKRTDLFRIIFNLKIIFSFKVNVLISVFFYIFLIPYPSHLVSRNFLVWKRTV